MADEPTTATMRPTISAGWADTMISAAIAKAAATSVAVTAMAWRRDVRGRGPRAGAG